ncbi:hypothetical protein F4819DRAFT_493910 [Hypoxylon fuscum]|nr:hypothetical protein F4819DRAFT_493910 [Hypoxylon fuscum]
MDSKQKTSTTGRIEMWDGTKDGEKAYLDPSTGDTNLNLKKVHHVTVHDIRVQDPQPTLRVNGYEVAKYPTQASGEQLLNNTTPEGKQFIREHYWPEVARFVQEKSCAAHVVPWHFSVRKQTLGYHPDEIFFMRTGVSQPASTVHIDNSHETAMDHMTRELGADEAERLVGKYRRWAIINTWRPIAQPVQRWPLLVVDHSGLNAGAGLSFEDDVGRVYRRHDSNYYKSYDNFLKYHPDYVYRYASNLAPDEVIVFKDYDSRRDRVRGTPHGGFQNDATPDDAPARNSIEVRVFAFFDDEQ